MGRARYSSGAADFPKKVDTARIPLGTGTEAIASHTENILCVWIRALLPQGAFFIGSTLEKAKNHSRYSEDESGRGEDFRSYLL